MQNVLVPDTPEPSAHGFATLISPELKASNSHLRLWRNDGIWVKERFLFQYFSLSKKYNKFGTQRLKFQGRHELP